MQIVTRLEDAPERGDAAWQLKSAQFPHGFGFVPVRNREALFFCHTIAGWQTTAKEIMDASPECSEGMLRADKHCLPGYVFAPDAETAVKRFNETQAFGEIKLCTYLCFESERHGEIIQFSSAGMVAFGDPDDDDMHVREHTGKQPAAIHALLGEIIAYQTAHAAGRTDSRIHRAIAEMERTA